LSENFSLEHTSQAKNIGDLMLPGIYAVSFVLYLARFRYAILRSIGNAVWFFTRSFRYV